MVILKQDFLRLLREDSEFKDEVRRLVLADEILGLPKTVADLTDRMDALAAQVAALTARMDDLTVQVAALTARMDDLTARVDALAIQVAALTARMDALTARVDALAIQVAALTARMDTLTARVDALTTQIAELIDRMDVMSRRQDRMADDIADLKGDALEAKMANRLVPIICKNMRLRTGRIVIGGQPSEVSVEFNDAIYDAYEKGVIEEREYDRIIDTDMIISAICRDSKSPAYVAVEASFVVDANDVARARRSAEILAKAFPSAETRSAAYGKFFNPAGRADAEKLGVSIIRAPRHPREAPR